MILALDLSTSCTGCALIDYEKNTYILDKIVCKEKNALKRIWSTVKQLESIFPKVSEIVIEDTFVGINPKVSKTLDRLGGAVIYTWINISNSEPALINAVNARKILGLNTQLTKAEYQLWVISNYFPNIDIREFEIDKVELRKKYVNKKITKKHWKNKIDSLSSEIATKTGIDNNQADSLILGLAYVKKMYNKEIKPNSFVAKIIDTSRVKQKK